MEIRGQLREIFLRVNTLDLQVIRGQVVNQDQWMVDQVDQATWDQVVNQGQWTVDQVDQATWDQVVNQDQWMVGQVDQATWGQVVNQDQWTVDQATWDQVDQATWGQVDQATWDQVDQATWGQVDKATWDQIHYLVKADLQVDPKAILWDLLLEMQETIWGLDHTDQDQMQIWMVTVCHHHLQAKVTWLQWMQWIKQVHIMTQDQLVIMFQNQIQDLERTVCRRLQRMSLMVAKPCK